MSRSRVDDRAHVIYAYLRDELNSVHTIGDLLKAVGLRDSCTTRAAIKRARQLAKDDGLYFPIPCPANGQTYCVTDDPNAVFDPALHLGRISIGANVSKADHDAFMKSRMHQLTPANRSMVHSLEQFEAAQRAQIDAYASITKAVVDMRREMRDSDDTL